jgi:hypothetical protein
LTVRVAELRPPYDTPAAASLPQDRRRSPDCAGLRLTCRAHRGNSPPRRAVVSRAPAQTPLERVMRCQRSDTQRAQSSLTGGLIHVTPPIPGPGITRVGGEIARQGHDRSGAGGARTHDRRIMRAPDNDYCSHYQQLGPRPLPHQPPQALQPTATRTRFDTRRAYSARSMRARTTATPASTSNYAHTPPPSPPPSPRGDSNSHQI